MIDKTMTIDKAISRVTSGDTIMVGGFGIPGTPFCLIDELVNQGQTGLTIIKNDANEVGKGIDRLLENGQVNRLITSHIGLNPHANTLLNNGQLEIEFCAQGILAERIRAQGAGLKAILTDIGVDTILAEGKQNFTVDETVCVIEMPIKANVALVHASSADPFGNLQYNASAQNFNPLMAMAADCVIAETEQLLSLGGISANSIHTPGPFVNCVVLLKSLSEDYAVAKR